MPKITRHLVAVALAVTSIAAFAQQGSGRTDRFGQPVTALGESDGMSAQAPASASQEAQRRVSIRNNTTDATDDAADDSEPSAITNPAVQANGTTQEAGQRRLQQQQQQRASGPRARAPVTSEFQKFIADSTGKILPIYGTEFFANAAATFAPISGAPVPTDYPLGAGDELMIRGWGSIDIDYRAKIDRNGLISIPTVGSIPLAGVKAGDAESVIRGAIAKLYKGVTVNVNFGKLRAITVYVVGQANRPGTYTVSSLSTLVTTLFASGGPNPNGSMRHLQVKRSGKIVAELDLYAFIAKGDKSADIKLQDGDAIYIPSASGYVALVGKVNTPAIYELRTGSDTVESLLDFAGGLPVVADPRRAYLERIDANKSQPRSVEQFALNGEGLKRSLKNGDVLNITSITPDFSNAVVLRGNVDQSIRAPFQAGMRISDLIPNREYLITRSSIKRQNNAIGTSDATNTNTNNTNNTNYNNNNNYNNNYNNTKSEGQQADTIASRIGGLIDEINWDYAVVERINRTDLTVSLIPFNLGKVFSNPAGTDNIRLQPGDTVTIFSQQDVAVPIDKRRVFVRVEGEVNVPGVYQMTSGETLQTLITRAGGATSNAYAFGTAFYREQVRKEQEANLEKAADRLEAQLRNEQSSAMANMRGTTAVDAQMAEARRQSDMLAVKDAVFRLRSLKPSGRIVFAMDPSQRSLSRLPTLKLENGDRLVIPARPEFVHVFGSVNAEGSPLWRPNSRVKDYLQIAGVSRDADVENAFILRVDGSVVARASGNWFQGGFGGVEVMPGDSIVIPEKMDKETAWTKFTQGTREWAQIFANFGLGAAAIQTLRN
jgi:protein involved in polysaccharide export with SLBB domain